MPSASGSAYLELESQLSPPISNSSAVRRVSSFGLKLTCTVHGPRPLPRSAPFSPHIILTTHVKHAPFSTRQRRGYIRDASERDLSVHLETALRGVIIGDRWPKSGVEVVVTILEGEDDKLWGDMKGPGAKPTAPSQMDFMSVLSGCITVASAAIADAGIDCVDVVSGGVAALVRDRQELAPNSVTSDSVVLDPVASEHHEVLATCAVAYLSSRDEITDLWVKGELQSTGQDRFTEKHATYDLLIESAIQAARGSYSVLTAVLKESAELRLIR